MTSLPDPGRRSSEYSNLSFERNAQRMRSRLAKRPSKTGTLIRTPPLRVLNWFQTVADQFQVSLLELTTPGKSRPEVTQARRWITLELWSSGVSFSEIGQWLGVNHSSIIHLFHTASERERREVSDRYLGRIERQRLIEEVNQRPISIPDLSGEWAI